MKYIALILFFSISINSINGQKLKTFNDSLSYMYGALLAEEVKGQMVEGLDSKFIKAGFDAKMDDKLDEEFIKQAHIAKFKVIEDNRKKVIERNKKEGADFLEKIAQEEGVQEGDGYYYKILQEGAGESPEPGAVVTIHYEGSPFGWNYI